MSRVEKPCFVYLIGRETADGLAGPIKVGIATHPGKRLRELQTGSPYRLAVVAAIRMPIRQAAVNLEKAMHAALGDDGLVGEWFNVNPFQAAGILCGMTRDMLEAMGGSGKDLERVLDWSGATALMSRWMNEKEARSQ